MPAPIQNSYKNLLPRITFYAADGVTVITPRGVQDLKKGVKYFWQTDDDPKIEAIRG